MFKLFYALRVCFKVPSPGFDPEVLEETHKERAEMYKIVTCSSPPVAIIPISCCQLHRDLSTVLMDGVIGQPEKPNANKLKTSTFPTYHGWSTP